MAQQWIDINKMTQIQNEKWGLIAEISDLEQSIEAHRAALEDDYDEDLI